MQAEAKLAGLFQTIVGGAVGGSLSSWASFQLAVTYGDAVDLLAI